MVALQNPKQFSGRLSFISLFISVRGDGYRNGRDRGKGCRRQKRDGRIMMLLGCNPSRSLSFFSSSFFFLVTYCWVECNFLTLKISGWGAPTFRRQTGCRSRRERSEGWMMRKMKKSESERERVYTHIYMCARVGWANESEKKSRAERKDYIGDFGFRVSSGRKADFPIFRLSRNEDRHSN